MQVRVVYASSVGLAILYFIGAGLQSPVRGMGFIDNTVSAGLFFFMDPLAKLALVIGLFSFTFMLNLPFGFLRSKTRKRSFNWFLCIHLPIPIIIMGRLFSNLSYKFIPVFILAAIIGQIFGGKLEL